MNKQIKNIIVVGGGTAGLISALILKQKHESNIDITVIKSDKIGIIGVGEGSTEHWSEFMSYCGITHEEIIKECDATLKCGILFKDWGTKDYLHSLNEITDLKLGMERIVCQKLISENKKLTHDCYDRGLVPKDFKNRKGLNQYHFNTNKLNDFLINKCKKSNVKIIDDIIDEVIFNQNGEIEKLKSSTCIYQADFFIDSTGFKKLLIGKLGAKWQSYEKYLKLNSAIVFPTGDTENYNVFTLAKAMKYGWRFRIPVWGRHGNGYIFDNNFITADQAKEEIDKEFGYDVEIKKEIKFTPGALDKVWIKNCVAVGLSANFVEPLEATSIGTSIQQIFLLNNIINSYNEKTIEFYNNQVNIVMNNIRDFIILHYICERNDTNFWKSLKTNEIPDTLKEKLELWKNRLPIEEDFDSRYCLFFDENWTHVLYGLNLIDKNIIKNTYNPLGNSIKRGVENFLKDTIKKWNNSGFMTHKELINYYRNK